MTTRGIGIIACGVLEWNIERIRERIPDIRFEVCILPAQLHNNPVKLRELLQENIDRFDREETALDGVVLAYGTCGRGTLGLFARGCPLVLARAQDCIGILLGSHQRHMEEFAENPGTRYLSEGWYSKTQRHRPVDAYHTRRNASLYGTTFEDLQTRYGEENARFICEFRESWKQNYRRAAYIRFEGEGQMPDGQKVTQGLADSLNWEHEVIPGDESLLYAMMNGDWEDPRILVVPPGKKTVSAPGDSVVGFTAGLDSHLDQLLEQYEQDHPLAHTEREGIGLGIDTGGTYTDAVLYDFSEGRVLAGAKAPTNHHELMQGIRGALDQLPETVLKQVRRVGLSTTLATNAFVEKRGRPVGLIMLTSLSVDRDRLPFRFVRVLPGGVRMDGNVAQPVDAERVRQCAREARDAGCEALAISGFGSVVDPKQEIAAAGIAFEASGLHAVCGHELTSELNFVERATTAAMNAKLVPMIESLIDAVELALADRGLRNATVMVVKGDGSQLLADVARQVPVETVLSGPAASVVGAAKLQDHGDAVVADMGGTTLDVAVLRNGTPVLSNAGARIGGFQTSVRAMAASTVGLGGDSEIDLSDWPNIVIGPRRVLPFCRIADLGRRLPVPLRDLIADAIGRTRHCTDIVSISPGVEAGTDRILEQLAKGPIPLGLLARRLNRAFPDHIPWRELESRGAIVRCGLTLTDVLHVQGTFTAFDTRASHDVLMLWASLLEVTLGELTEAILHEFRRVVCDTVLGVAFPADCPWEEGGLLRRWLTGHISRSSPGEGSGLEIQVRLPFPLVGVGAPVGSLFPSLSSCLHQEVIVSEHAGVANAVGAIAGDVMLRQVAAIRARDDGALVCSWRGSNQRAVSLEDALRVCREALTRLLAEDARANAIPESEPHFSVVRHQADTRDGPVFMGVTLVGEIKG